MKHILPAASLLVSACLFFNCLSAQTTKPDSLINIGISATPDNSNDTIPYVSLDENDNTGGSVQTVSSSGKGLDVFSRAAIFNFNPVRFRIRSYSLDNAVTFMNGVPTNDIVGRSSSYGLFTGLNDETRNRYTVVGLHNNPFSFGGVGNSTFIDTRASKQRRQTSISFTQTNSYIKSALAITYSSGMSKKGWAFTLSSDRRYSDEGYIPGTYYNGWGYFAGVDKKIGKKQLLSLVVFEASSESGGEGHATQESFGLANSHYYNPDWGYQSGKKRNARIYKSNQPTGILSHEFSINKRTSLLTAASYTFGNRSTSRLDWYDAPNPAPDYYSYLPSYQFGPGLMQQVANQFKSDFNTRQINWQQLYNVNRIHYDTVQNVNGVAGNTVSGLRSLYILSDRVTNTKRFNFNTTLNTLLTDNITLTAGLAYQMQKNNYYEKVLDLLGGQFFVDVDQYAELDFPNSPDASQNNLNNPNQILHVGDKYGYNYNLNASKASGFAQLAFHYKKVDFFVAGEGSYSSFWRVGYYKNGLFPDSSFGKSTVNNFTNYGAKAGVSYRLERGSYLYLNAAYLTTPPNFEDAYLDAEVRSATQSNLRSQDIQSVEGGYILNSPIFNVRLTGYYSTFRHGFDVTRFFSYTYNEFVDYAVSNINTVQFGGEFGAQAKIVKNVTIEAAAAVGRAYYDDRQLVTISQDNNNTLLAPAGTLVYTKNYRLPNTPQEAYSLSVNYRSRHYWYVDVTGNYFDQMWSGINPDRRTALSVQGVDSKSALYGDILNQEKFPGEFMLGLRLGKSWKLSNIAGIGKIFLLGINGGVNNILNNQGIISNGYEGERTSKFPTGSFDSKYTYAEGINYYIKATLRFY